MSLSAAGAIAAKSALSSTAKTGAAKLTSDFYRHYVQPKFDGLSAQKAVLEGLRKYIRSLEKSTRYIPTIAIQGSQFELDDVYEPTILVQSDDKEGVEVSSFPQEVFGSHSRVLVVDAAGMGKSTFSKYIIRRALEGLQVFPVLVELRRVKSGQDLASMISSELIGLTVTDACKKKLHDAFESGDFLFVFDGYDELSEEARQEVSSEISRLCTKYPSCKFLLTSRPDAGLASFAGFVQYNIKPLDRARAFNLLRRYDQNRGKADNLIEKIRAQPQVNEFLGNPLLVTLLYKAYDYRASIPIKRNIFFRQVFEALYQDHDLSKEGAFERRKKCALDMEDFHRAVRALGIASLKTGRIQYTPDEFSTLLDKAAELAPSVHFDITKLKADLLSAVPLFIKDGTDIRWSHKAFQDYFSAQFICSDMGVKAGKMVNHLMGDDNFERFEGVLALVGEADVDLVRSSYVMPYMKKLEREFLKAEDYPRSDEGFIIFIASKVNDVFAIDLELLGKDMDAKTFGRAIDHVKRKYRRVSAYKYAQLHTSGESYLLFLMSELRDRLRLLSSIDPEIFSWVRGGFAISDESLKDGLSALVGGDLVLLNDKIDFDDSSTFARWLRFVLTVAIPFKLPLYSKIKEAEARLVRVASVKAFDDLLSD